MAIAVLVTIPQDEANNLAKVLLEKRVCACVNIIKGVKSYFWWKGKIDDAEESILIIKTKDTLFSKLKEEIKKSHSYTVPEIISFKINEGNKEYLDWLYKECSTQPKTVLKSKKVT